MTHLSDEAALVVRVVGDGLDPAVRQVHLVAALHLPQLVLGLGLGEGVAAVVILHSVLVLEGLRRELHLLVDGGGGVGSLALLGVLLLLPVHGHFLPLEVHLVPVDGGVPCVGGEGGGALVRGLGAALGAIGPPLLRGRGGAGHEEEELEGKD